MKKRDIERRLQKAGWWLARHGGNHDIWTNGSMTTQVPRHPEVNEYLARSIVRDAEENPGEKRR
jgi:mRNA interferase HicA